MKKRGVFLTIIAALFFICNSYAYAGQSLNVVWAESDPSRFLQQLVLDFEKETGIKVMVDMIPWSHFQEKLFREFAAKGDNWDMVIGDSQWVGAGATQGHYVELTDWIKKNRVDKTMTKASMICYSEYPKESGKYWSVPGLGSAMAYIYRKDWFEDPKEKAAFKKKYGYELGEPKTYYQLRDIAAFFYRPNENRYGVAIYTDKGYDCIHSGFGLLLYSWGADLGNQSTYQVDGILNSKKAVEALECYKTLYKYTPPGWGNAFWRENNQAFAEGLVAMTHNFISFFPAMNNPAKNKYAKVTGYFVNPKGPSGDQYTVLGGQGISLIKYSKKHDLCFKFLEWFIREEVQKKWAELGGLSCNIKVNESKAFLTGQPYNKVYMESMVMVKDFWAVPEYSELQEVYNMNLNKYVVMNQGTAKDALDATVSDWQKIFRKYGRIK